MNELEPKESHRRVCGIYCIRNIITGEEYIGSSVDVHRRHLEHMRWFAKGIKHGRRLKLSWQKYGPEAHEFELLKECAEEELVEQENIIMNARKPTLNARDWAINQLHFDMPESAKAKISKKNKGRQPSESNREAVRSSLQTTCIGFLSPDGIVHSPVINISLFSKNYGLHYASMKKLKNGQLKSYKGWKRLTKEDIIG